MPLGNGPTAAPRPAWSPLCRRLLPLLPLLLLAAARPARATATAATATATGACARSCAAGSCLLNCSSRGLRQPPPARGPAPAAALDLSNNKISSLDAQMFESLTSLAKLDISHNQISTLEDGIFDNLFNLTEINLSLNPFLCDCKLSWLPRWAEERKVKVIQAAETKCAHPPEVANLSLFNISFTNVTCDAEYLACVIDNRTGEADAVVLFMPGRRENLTEEACSALCYAEDQDYGGFSDQGWCLCGAALQPNTSSACWSFCTEPAPEPACRSPALVPSIFPARLQASFTGHRRPSSLHRAVAFHLSVPAAVSTLRWDFGDLSGVFSTTRHAALHKYALPGRYNVTATLLVGSRVSSVQTEVEVVAPPDEVELQCPSLVRTSESLDLRIRNRGGTGLSAAYSITAESEELGKAVHPMCPSDGLVFPGNGYCYRLVVEKAEWLEAQQQCQEHGSGELAFVSTPEIQSFLVSRVIRSLDVWIGFNDFASAGAQQRGEGFNLESCQNWLPGEPHPSNADHCVRMGPTGQCNTDLCMAKHSYVCQYKPEGILLNADNFYVGNPAFDTHAPMRNVTREDSLSAPRDAVEMLMFPTWEFEHEGFLTAFEFVTQELQQPAQVRLQVHRPAGGEGYEEEASAAQPFNTSQDNGNWTLLECPAGFQWCHLTNTCVSQSSGCNTTECADNLTATTAPAAPGHDGGPLRYELLREFLFAVPAGTATQYLVLFGDESTLVRSKDVFSLQHDAGPGLFLQCQPSGTSPYRHRYLSTNSSDWSPHLPASLTRASWQNDTVCSLRVLYAAEQVVPMLGQPNPGLEHRGRYTVKATVDNGVFSANLSCSFWVISPVTGLRVIYPPAQGGIVYVPTNHSSLVVKISSGVNATASWLGGNWSFPFEGACPPAVVPPTTDCARDTNDTWFSVVGLGGLGDGVNMLVLVAENAASAQNITISVKVEEPIRGLRATPDPESRVLLNTRVSYVPMLEAGSDVTFRWTVDDKPSFTFYNVVFNVIYQSAAVYKLSLTASNHVSNVTVDYNVTVEKMNKMKNLSVSGIPAVLPQNATVELTASVVIDTAVDAAFVWDFGDGTHETYQFKPPYNGSFLIPDPSVHEVVIEQSASHTYEEPGEYTLVVLASNPFENLTHQIPVYVHVYLIDVKVDTDTDVLAVNRPVNFTAYPVPSPYGVLYTWDFGDGSSLLTESQPTAVHSYQTKGVYNVSLKANNTVSSVETFRLYRVFEEIAGLHVSFEEAVEVGMSITINASVEAGDNITWIFDMGDGTVQQGPLPAVEHIYEKDINCTVNVTAANPVSSVSQSVPLRIFVLEVLKIEPSSCILEHPDVQITAYVSGNPDDYVFDWTFGDGSSNVTVYGDPTVMHNFTRSGIFPLSLVLSSSANKAHYFTSVCVEPEIINVTLLPPKQFARLGEESWFQVSAVPLYQYRYRWDFGTNESTRSSGTEVSYSYKSTGIYLVTVTVSNNVSFNNDTAFVEVQEPVGVAKIEYNGTRVLELNQIYLFSASANGTKVSYRWDFGDGSSQRGQAVTHTYNTTGSYAVSMTGWNNVSFNETRVNVTVKRRLQGLTINASRTVVPLNGSVSFVAILLAGRAVRHSWILCDYCTPIQGSSTISYTFRSVGTFNVIVTAENEISSLQDSIYVFVLEQIKGLQIASGDLVEDAFFPTNKTLHLQAVVREGTNISYSWAALRDGCPMQTFGGKTFSLSILEAGNYTIHLKATNMLGSAAVNRTVEFIESIGLLKPSAFPNPTAVNTTVNISTSITSGTGVAYFWHLGDGFSPRTVEPFVVHSFQSPGAVEVTIRAENKLGATNATILVFVQEPVVGLRIETPKLDYIASGCTVVFDGKLQKGTNVTWLWELDNSTINGQMVPMPFPVAGTFSVFLNASNDVSWLVVSRNITVQDEVRGLELFVSKKVVEPGEEVSFVINMISGSSVTYMVSISRDYSVVLNGSKYTHAFTNIGDYLVTATVQNQVSSAHTHVLISVLDAIRDLRLLHCCEPGIPTGTEQRFTAQVGRGSQVGYSWQFSLQTDTRRYVATSAGDSVPYTPAAAGLLEIHLSAFNGLGSVNLTRVIQVQDQIIQVTLRPSSSFVNRTAVFEASVVPSARQVVFWWSFGDGSPARVTEVAAANYSYLSPGDFLVQVNATNLVSFFIAQVTVTVRVLECEEPEVELALPPQVVMKRSQRSYLEAQIDLRGCIKYQTEYLWEIYRAPSCRHLGEASQIRLPGVDVNRPQLVIPKLALKVGHYCFVFIVSFGDTPLSKSIFANVTVIPSKLVPIIDGGSYRVWSNTQDLILDGEKSYDPNLDDSEQTPLHYQWSCASSSKSSAAGCSLNFSALEGTVTISKATLEANVEYTFDLTVSKEGMSPEATNQTVLIKKGGVPIVSLECVSCKAQSVYEVSKSSYIYLEGTCQNCQNDSKLGRWAAQSFKNKSLVLDKRTTSTGNAGMNLVLRQGVLKDGEGYTFTLHITDLTTGEEGYASIDLLPNRPPFGGTCRLFPHKPLEALMAKVHFECKDWRDTEDEEAPLVYILLATRCKAGHCEQFCVYKGSHSEHSAFLPPGFQASSFLVHVSVLVQDQLGATAVALNRSMTITLPTLPDGHQSLSRWLCNRTDTVLQGLVKQGDPQQVIEYSLALITILNEYEHALYSEAEASHERALRIWTRTNITETLISLSVNTVDDIQQISAALAQCTVASKEFVCRSCLTRTLNKLESMMAILQGETTQGTMTPTAIADNILNITGDLIHLVNAASPELKPQELFNDHHHVLVASKAYSLSSSLMRILMKSRVLNEEPLELAGGEIVAKGKRSDPFNLLCYENTPDCQFSIPQAFNTTFSDLTDVIQVMFRVDSNPFPFGYISNYTVSTEVASMEFQTNNGTQIPIGSLDSEKAITVMVSNNTEAMNISAGTEVIPERTSVNLVVTTENNHREAGLHFQLTYRILNDRYLSSEPEPFVAAYLHDAPAPSEHNCSAAKKIGLEALARKDHKQYTFFISPVTDDTTKDYYLNITNHFSWSAVEVTLGLYTSLCQYFCEQERRWKTEGIVPLEDTRPDQAVCLTQHLTAFGASLFVPPNSVRFIFPAPGPGLNYIVLLTCAVCFVTYSVAALIVHKLDLIDVNRVGVIPFCGKNGQYKYEILVKTGWGRGSGTTAHVGITLYGADNKSGHRHLDGENTFHRNGLDVFQIATERSLGSVWKIRVWHDNKGLSPSWYLQHIIVRDLQSSKSYFFLVNDWLSVESEENDGMVEKEVYAASENELQSFSRIFVAELQRGFFEKHVWLSMWDRPPRSRFTRVQRATCCSGLVFLFLCANAVWYGVVGDVHLSNVAVSSLIPVSVDTLAVGLVSSVVIYPLYLVILFLFRMARSKASVSHTLTHSDQQSLEIDNYLDSSLLESSFLTFPGLRAEAVSEQTKTDLLPDDSKSLIQWPSSEALLTWPDLLSDPSIMGNTIQKLKRGRTSRHLGLETPLAAEDGLSLGLHQGQARYISASDEDLIRQILADGASGISHSQDVGHYGRAETDLISGLSSVFGEKTETIVLQKLNEKGQSVAPPPREVSRSAKPIWTATDRAFQKRLLPSWCSYLAHAISLLLVAACFGVSVWIGLGFTSSVALMWLISGIFSFLASFLIWEPLKVLVEALYFSLVAKRLHPEEDDTLVENPFVEHVSEKINKVRPPQGFALFQAKEEARKVKLLHKMLKNFLIYMLFLLVNLLTSYGDASRNSQAFLLQSSIKQQLGSEDFLCIKRSDEFWVWMSQVLLPYLYNNQSGRESHSLTLGVPRLRQLRSQEDKCLDPIQEFLSGTDTAAVRKRCMYRSGSFDASDHTVGWDSGPGNRTATWSYSPPDLAGVWYWGYFSVYDSGGYTQELGTTLEDSRARLDFLQHHGWIDNMSRAVFVELTQYNPGVDLHVAITLRLEFPVAGHAVTAVNIQPFPLRRLSGGVTLQLVMMVFLMMFVVYFVVSESLAIKKEGRAYFVRLGSYAQWLLILLTTCSVVVHLSQATIADQQWAKYLKNRRGFTSFYQVAFLNSVFSSLAASLLFLLTIKAAQQLRFVRQWSVFGKTLQKSAKELAAAGLAFGILALAYAQLGFLLFSSCSESFRSFGSSLLLLFALVRGSATLRPSPPEPSGWHGLFCASYVVLELWVVLRLFAAVLLHRYREMHFELYRPAFEPQDYEMVELFVRRLKMWMGFSKAKEFRHKVRFEGMEPLPSRSSSDSKSFRGPTPSAASDSSRASTSSSQLDGLSLVLSARDSLEVDADLRRLLSLFEMLLAQFDRVNQVTEDVYRIEHQLEGTQSRRARTRRLRGTQAVPCAPGCGGLEQGENASDVDFPLPSRSPGAPQDGPGAVPSRLVRASRGIGVASPHKGYGTLAPAVKKRPLRAKNKVHPSVK
ncbi:polycystin-1 isoform X2 [Alligator mississippiensis]|uniref:polycystin-1 isoform X2 n=1 Tax=Alligator mississippiensis TaxID=8496 RepID=UPI002877609D|nr:polycystin-1 isoform X2 [Alligator mississippiensis]